MMDHLELKTIDGYNISAVVSRTNARNVVVWLHGICVDKDEYLGFFRDGADWLRKRGTASVRFDFRGHGESGGKSTDFSIVGQNLDTQVVLEFVQREFVGARVHLVGASFGAPPAIFAAKRFTKRIESVTLIAPVLSYERTFLRAETEWAKELFATDRLEKLERSGRLYFDSTFCVSARLVEEMRVIHPEMALSGLKHRVMVIHGNRDSMVPYDASKGVCRGLKHVRFVTLEGADHGFMQEGDEEGTTRQSIANRDAIFRLLEEHIGC